jgi:hypothetical protein
MKVHKLTAIQKNKLIGIEYIPNCTYNPVQDANDVWIITTEEVEQTTDENFLWVKDLPQIEYVKPKYNAS